MEEAKQDLSEQLTLNQLQTQALRKRQTELDGSRQERQTTIQDLQQQSVSKDQTRSQLLADSERLQALLQQLRTLRELDGRFCSSWHTATPCPRQATQQLRRQTLCR